MSDHRNSASSPLGIQALIRSVRDSFAYTPRTLRLAWGSSPGASLGIALLTLVSAALPIAIAYTGKIIIDEVVAKAPQGTVRWVVLEFVLVAFSAGVQRSLFLLRSLLGARLGIDVNLRILDKALDFDLRHFEDSEFYDKLTRARREASSRPVAMVSDLWQLIQNALTLTGYAVVLLSFHPWASVALIVAALPATLAEMRFSNAAFRLRNWRSPDARRLNYVEYVLANDAHVKEVKLHGIGRFLLDRYRRLSETFFEEDKQLSIRRSGWAYALSLLATIAFYGAYATMALAAAWGQLTLGNLTLYVIAFRQGQQAFQSCLTAIGSMYEHNLYLSNLFEYLAITTTPKAGETKASSSHLKEFGIRFEKVSFQYPGSQNVALQEIDLFIPKGESLALVGHNGAGKTTFVKLLTRLYDPTAGRILLDGIDLREYDNETLWKRFSVVFQDYNRYQLTFRENIGLGSLPHLEATDKILAAVQRGGANEVLAQMPKGLESPLGKWFLEGTELSGGQWQKIALARGFIREESDILILDEPTAALDAEAEYAVFERFRELAKDRTSIVISHRFPTVRLADRIIVIEGGRIREQGTHSTLLALQGRYAELFTIQAKGYL